MHELDASNAAQYLIERGWLAAPAAVRQMTWGVSNVVLWVDAPERPIVVKQSRKQLRTRELWFSDLDRIYREADAMRALRPILTDVVPQVLFEDRENYLFAMSAAPTDATVWKQQLLAGVARVDKARKAAEILAQMHVAGADNQDWCERFGDQTNFHQLRLEPYYQRLPLRFPDLAASIERLVSETCATKRTLVHADYSPKNMLFHGESMTLVDYETVHFGDPAFDLGFFLAHLSLKAIHHRVRCKPYLDLIAAFWETYLAQVGYEPRPQLIERSSAHLAGNLLVRIDGASPVEYLESDAQRETGRAYARHLFESRPDDWTEMHKELASRLSR